MKKIVSTPGFRLQHGSCLYVLQNINFYELNDIKQDRQQQHNVAEDHPELVLRLKEKMLPLPKEMINERCDWFTE
jgi:hypothetical protein